MATFPFVYKFDFLKKLCKNQFFAIFWMFQGSDKATNPPSKKPTHSKAQTKY